MKRSLTTGEVAKYCGVNHRTVLRWIKAGHLEAFQLPGRGDHRVPVETCVAFLEKHEIPIPDELVTEKVCRRVLIVEDEAQVARLIDHYLQKEGFETQIAEDGFQAGAMLATFQPGLMTLDLNMPRLKGSEVLKFVRTDPRFRTLKVLVISGMGEEELQAALEAGADAVLTKPFKSAALIAEVRRLLKLKD